MTAVPVPPAPADYETKIREAWAALPLEDGPDPIGRLASTAAGVVAAEVAAERERIAQAVEQLPETQDHRFIGRDGAAAMMRADAAGVARGWFRCYHCWTWGPTGDDHTCPCPNRNQECEPHDKFAWYSEKVNAISAVRIAREGSS